MANINDILKRIDMLNDDAMSDNDDILRGMGSESYYMKEQGSNTNKIDITLLRVACNELQANLKEYDVTTSGGKNACTIKFSNHDDKEVLRVRIRANVWSGDDCVCINNSGLTNLLSYMLSNATYEVPLKKLIMLNYDKYEITCSISYKFEAGSINCKTIASFICSLFNWVYNDGELRTDKNKEVEELIRLHEEKQERRRRVVTIEDDVLSHMAMTTDIVKVELPNNGSHNDWVRPKPVICNYKFKEDELVQ